MPCASLRLILPLVDDPTAQPLFSSCHIAVLAPASRLDEESKVDAGHSGSSQRSVSARVDALDRQTCSSALTILPMLFPRRRTVSDVPGQMPDAIEGVESERHGEEQLRRALQPSGHGRDEVDEVRRVDGGDDGVEEVRDRGGVERAGEGDTGDSVRDGEEPCDLDSALGHRDMSRASSSRRPPPSVHPGTPSCPQPPGPQIHQRTEFLRPTVPQAPQQFLPLMHLYSHRSHPSRAQPPGPIAHRP